jgi:hypothetical protein
MLTYATTAQLAVWTGAAAPTNAAALLRSASLLVRRATLTAIYDVDAQGMPTAPDVAAAFRDATCTQAATWASLGIDPAKGAADTLPVSKSLGSASITYATHGVTTGRADAAVQLAQEARLILAEAGLS